MNNPLGNFADEAGEVIKDTTRDIVVEAKKQVLGKKDKDNKKQDPVTGKPVPSKKALTQLTQATAQLQFAKLKKVREELEKQRLKTTSEKQKLAPIESNKAVGKGPAIASSEAEGEKAPPPEAVTATLRGSKSTGEFGRQVGG